MNARVKKLVDALRSGKYEQTRGKLRDGNKFCCLGVACDVYAKEHKDARWFKDTFYVGEDIHESYENYENVYLPKAVIEWFGFDEKTGRHDNGSLMKANDSGTPFDKIANIIENEESLYKHE